MQNSEAKALVGRAQEKDLAYVSRNSTERPQSIQKIVLDLSTARPRENSQIINFQFKALAVEASTDPSVKIWMLPNTREDVQSPVLVGLKDAWIVDYPVAKAFLFWDAQPGKSITINFYADSQFRSGSQISVTSGGVSVSEGSTVSAIQAVTLVAATAGIIAPQDFNRKLSYLENKTGGIVYLGGDNTVNNAGATEGIIWNPGEKLQWRNTAALYGYSVGGGKVSRLDEA